MGEDTDAPFTFIVNSLKSGGYLFAAKAFDDHGASSSSQPVAVIVNAPPVLTFQSPSKDTSVLQGTPVTVKMNVTDSDGEIIKVELLLNGVKIAEDAQAPYTFPLNNLPLGKHQLRARAWDDVDDLQESKLINLTVGTTTSTRELQYTDLRFFPNPVRERLFLQGMNELTRVRIFDVAGRLVVETRTVSEVNLQNLTSGRYWLITEDGRRAAFVKQ